MRIKPKLYLQDFEDIKTLYWDEGWNQFDISQKYQVDQGTISKIINDKGHSIEDYLKEKYETLQANINIQPQSKQGLVNRALRENRSNTKLTQKKVNQIRNLYFSGQDTQMNLAKRFNVNQSTINKLLSGQDWRNIIK